jgi:hypothetical protein
MCDFLEEVLPTTVIPPPPGCPDVQYGGASGIILSPNYPNNYGDNMNCDYRITVDDSNLVVMVRKNDLK